MELPANVILLFLSVSISANLFSEELKIREFNDRMWKNISIFIKNVKLGKKH